MKLQLRDSVKRERADQPPTTVMPIVKLQQTLNAFQFALADLAPFGTKLPSRAPPRSKRPIL